MKGSRKDRDHRMGRGNGKGFNFFDMDEVCQRH